MLIGVGIALVVLGLATYFYSEEGKLVELAASAAALLGAALLVLGVLMATAPNV